MKWITILVVFQLVLLEACQQAPPKRIVENIPQNIEVQAQRIFLSDAIPLKLSFDIQWSIIDTALFDAQFDTTQTYNDFILIPRTKELCTQISGAYRIQDFNRSQKIQHFREDVASALLHHLSEKGTLIDEVQLTKIEFPPKFARYQQKAQQYLQSPPPSLPPAPMEINELIVSQQERLKLQLSTLQMLVKAEKIAGEKFILNSGYRDRVHNRMVGGVANSAHLRGLAMDISFKSQAQKKRILNALKKAGFQRIGVYYNHIHADNDYSLPTPSRW